MYWLLQWVAKAVLSYAFVRAFVHLIGIDFQFLEPYLNIILPLAGIVLIVCEVRKIARKSGILKHKTVEDIVYLRDPKKSGTVFASFSIALYIICNHSIITIITYTLLFITGVAAAYRLYKSKKETTNTEDPFSEIIVQYLLPLQKISPSLANSLAESIIYIYDNLVALILAKNPRESVKFSLILLTLKYIAQWFVEYPFIMIVVCYGVFLTPKIYKDNQKTIDPLLTTCSEYIEKVKKW